MLAEGVDCSVELLPDRVLVRKSGKITADIPVHDIDETRFRPASAFNEGHLQIRARKTVIDGMNGTAFFKTRSLDAFTVVRNAIDKQIVPHDEEPQDQTPLPKPPESMRAMLSSGSWIEIKQIKLYSGAKVAEIAHLRSTAAKAVGPSGSAFGVIGSPGLAFAAESAALGIVSSLIASAAQGRASESITKALTLHHDMLMYGGQYFDVASVAKITIPNPSVWSAMGEAKETFVHSGESFLWVKTPQGPFMLNWLQVSVISFPEQTGL